MRQHEKIHTQYKDCGHVCTKAVNIKTQTQASTHAHTNVRTLARTHRCIPRSSAVVFFFALALERVDAMLSAELLEILWDGVCGSDKLGVVRQA